jgi:hypothetical protein
MRVNPAQGRKLARILLPGHTSIIEIGACCAQATCSRDGTSFQFYKSNLQTHVQPQAERGQPMATRVAAKQQS